MSTINDALKKAQEQKQEKQEEILAVPQQKQSPQLPKKELPKPVKKTAPKIIQISLFFSAAVILAVFGFYILNSMHQNKSQQPKIQTAITEDTVAVGEPQKSSVQPETAPTQQQPQTPQEVLGNIIVENVLPAPKFPRLVLNGIMYDDKSPMAIINNKIVVEGGAIENATVVKILRNRVILSCQGQEIQLEVK